MADGFQEGADNAEPDDSAYRRMMSEELAAQWDDASDMSDRSWSLGQSVVESGFGSITETPCRKCTLAEEMFLCPESRTFWERIPSSVCCRRIWKDFIDTFREDFPEEQALVKKRVMNIFKCLLGVEYQDLGEIAVEDFLRLIRFFGPFRAEEDRCVVVKQIEQLVENSFQKSKDKKSKICWFGGYMTRSEAETKLKDQKPGTFLIRMSVTEGDAGCFALGLVMLDNTIEHFQIKGHPDEAVTMHPFSLELEFKGRHFSSLPDLVNNCLCQEVIASESENPENGVRCSIICPGLPYNQIINGYKCPAR
ncbi:uncharacterized protein LOC124147696 [Haliotis rufescens]|uniref:uncharacterized protein LOC124147696 n=1 Tax=Haliotis rufescens TaxID=6454 RepID=UPI00201F9909|nr:uncharacterized protein LOC124147696 [Haliotis rufescens]